MNEDSLWNSFNLAENNLDQGGGILYCLKYTPERIKAHQESIVASLKSEGFMLEDKDDGRLALIPPYPMKNVDQKRLLLILEELSVLNEALEYAESGFCQYNTISELSDGLKSMYYSHLIDKNGEMAYGFVTKVIPQFARDLRIANLQSKLLSTKERKTIDDLVDFAKKKAKNLETGIVIIGG